MKKKKDNDDDLPKLSIEQENEFKKMKLKLEHDAIFPDSSQLKLPPEIEGMFLDSIFNFEKAHKNAKKIKIFEKLGFPDFKPAEELSDKKLEKALEKLEKLMEKHHIGLDVLCDYEDEARLVYKFITEELFNLEILDVSVKGMNTVFIYEDFYPNYKDDLERSTEGFLKMFFDTKSDFYEKYHEESASNHLELNNFRSLFKKFKVKDFEIKTVVFDLEKELALTTFDIQFWGRIAGTDAKITYNGFGSMSFIMKNGFWYTEEVLLPINDKKE
jgi:hypothetical protein